MAVVKEHDWVLETIYNPTYTNTDFKVAGINSNNTSIQPLDVYLKLPEIWNTPEFLTNGKFDRYKFESFYRTKLASFNKLARDTYEEDLDKDQEAIFAHNDVFVSPEKRMQGPKAVMTILDNPTRLTFGIIEINTPGKQFKTIEEIALLNLIWDSKTNSFTEETPEDSFFKNFFRPMALAVWEYDADANGNPTSDKSKIVHNKGDMKLHNGEPYYEFLNGKSGYGRLILSKTNILTKEDSWINKFDFFDNDDMEKSTFGSMMLNAARIVPLYIPYVGAAYMYTSLALSGTEALATLGKMFTGSENSMLNDTTSFLSSLHAGVSDYGKLHAFSMENILNMVGDTFQFIKSQRLLAENAPKWFGNKMLTQEQIGVKAQEMAEKETVKELYAAKSVLTEENYKEKLTQLMGVNINKYSNMLLKEVLNYQKLGEMISKNYMAITFGTHTYGAAKAEGVEDIPATLLTLGAIGGLYALLNSHIGKWIFPESNITALQNKMIIEKIPEAVNSKAFKTILEGISKAKTKAEKYKWAEKAWKKGVDFANKIYTTPAQTTAQAAITGGIASGVEMTAFSVLDDLVGQVYNTAQWIAGNPHRMHPWENMFERYATSFLGGGVAGLMSIPKLKDAAKQLHNITPEFAYKQMIQMVAEGKAEELLKYVDKVKWTTSDLSAEKFIDTENGRIYEQGSPVDNQNEAIRLGIRNEIKLIKDTLEAHNALVGSDGILSAEIRGPLKTAYMQNSVKVKDYISDYYSVLADIVTITKEMNSISDPKKREQRDDYKEAEKKYKELLKKADESNKQEDIDAAKAAKNALNSLNDLTSKKAELSDLLDQKNKFINGELAPKYMEVALFDMTEAISKEFYITNRILYAEKKFKKAWNELSAAEQAEAVKEYNAYAENNKSSVIDTAFETFKPLNKIASNFLKNIGEKKISEKLDFSNTKILKHIYDVDLGGIDVLRKIKNDIPANQVLDTSARVYLDFTEDTFNRIVRELRGKRPEGFNFESNGEMFLDVEIAIQEIQNKINSASGDISKLFASKENMADNLFNEIKTDLFNYIESLKNARMTLESLLYSGWATKMLKDEVDKLQVITPELMTKLNITIDTLKKLSSPASKITTVTRKFNSDFKLVDEILEIIPDLYKASIQLLDAKALNDRGEDKLFLITNKYVNLLAILKKLNSIPYFDLVEVLNDYGKEITNGNFDFANIYKIFSDLYISNIGDLELYLAGLADLNNIGLAITVLKLFKTGIIASNDVVKDFDNIFGYNTTVNSMFNNKELAVLPESDVAVLLDSINLMQEQLEFFERITYIASSNKFKELLKIDTDTIFNIYNTLTTKFNNIPDSWKGKQELLSELKGIEDLPDLIEAGSRDLTTEQRNQTIKGLIDFEKAIYKFFLKNQDNIKDQNKLATFLKLFDCYKKTSKNEAIGDKPDFVDDNAFIYYLASICALDPDIYYSNVAQGIVNGVAPTIVLSLAVRNMVAFVEGKSFDNFRKAYNINVSEATQIKNSTLHATFENIMLVEAGAGAGKSSGILPQFISMMRMLDKSKTKKIWFASTAKKDEPEDNSSAKKIRSNCNVLEDESRIFNKKLLMEELCGNYTAVLNESNVLQLKPEDVEYNKDTEIVTYANNKLKIDLNKDDIPGLLIIDECSDYSDLDFRIIDEFAKKYGVKVLLLGDLHQTGLSGEVEIKEIKKNYILGIHRTLFPRTFLNNTSFRTNNTLLDYNFRTDRAVLLPLFLDAKAKLLYRYYTDETGLYGRYIDQLFTLSDSLKSNFNLMLDTLDEGEKLGFVYDSEEGELYKYAHTLPNEKLNKIEWHKNLPIKGVEAKYYVVELSPDLSTLEAFENCKKVLYTAFSRAKLGNIIHLTESLGPNIYIKSTKQTSNGLLRPPTEAIAGYIELLKEFLPTIYPTAKKLPVEESKTEEPPKEIPGTNSEKDDDRDDEKDEELDDTEETDGESDVHAMDDEGHSDSFSAIPPKDVERSINKKNFNDIGIDSSIENRRRLLLRGIGGDYKETMANREVFMWELYTAFNNYTGLLADGDLGFKESSKADNRFDNYYGLKRLIELYSGDKDMLLELNSSERKRNIERKNDVTQILLELRELIWYTKDSSVLKDKIKEKLKTKLKLTQDFDDFYIRDMYEMGYVRKNDNVPYGKSSIESAFRSKEELLDGIIGGGADSKEVSGKGFALHIGAKIKDADGKIHDTVLLSIPYAKLPNPLTILRQLRIEAENGVSKFQWAKLLNDSIKGTNNMYERLIKAALILELTISVKTEKGKTITTEPGLLSLYYLIRAYLFNNDGYIPIIRSASESLFKDREKWTIARDLEASSPFILSLEKGTDYLSHKDFTANIDPTTGRHKVNYTEITKLRSNPLLSTSNIYITTEDVVDTSGAVLIQKGDPFILVGTRFNNGIRFSERDLFRHLDKQLNDKNADKKVKVVYVKPPLATIDEYLDLLLERINGKKLDYFIGNDFTSYRILQLLDLKVDKFEGRTYLEEIRSAINDSTIDEYFKIFEEFKTKLEQTLLDNGRKLSDLDTFEDNSNDAFKIAVQVLRTKAGKRNLNYSQVINGLVLKLLRAHRMQVRVENTDGTLTTFSERMFKDLKNLWASKYVDSLISYNTIFEGSKTPYTVKGKAIHPVIVDSGFKLADKEYTVNIVRTPVLVGDIFPLIASIGFAINGLTKVNNEGFIELGSSGIRKRVGKDLYENINLIKEGIRMPEKDKGEPKEDPAKPKPEPEEKKKSYTRKPKYVINKLLLESLGLDNDATLQLVREKCAENGYIWFEIGKRPSIKHKFAKSKLPGFENHIITSYNKIADDTVRIGLADKNTFEESEVEVKLINPNPTSNPDGMEVIIKTLGEEPIVSNKNTYSEESLRAEFVRLGFKPRLFDSVGSYPVEKAIEFIRNRGGSDNFIEAYKLFRSEDASKNLKEDFCNKPIII